MRTVYGSVLKNKNKKPTPTGNRLLGSIPHRILYHHDHIVTPVSPFCYIWCNIFRRCIKTYVQMPFKRITKEHIFYGIFNKSLWKAVG
jgi:hypothetical protein